MTITPYLVFNGRSEEAIAFYRQALGADVRMQLRFAEAPDQPPPGMLPPGSGQKIMHAEILVGASRLMLSDGGCTGAARFEGIVLTLGSPDEATTRERFAALADGGEVRMPLGRTFFSPLFGMVVDRFGLSWNVLVEVPMPAA